MSKFKIINIEINSDCNRRCNFCPRGIDKSRWVKDINGKNKLINNLMKINENKIIIIYKSHK